MSQPRIEQQRRRRQSRRSRKSTDSDSSITHDIQSKHLKDMDGKATQQRICAFIDKLVSDHGTESQQLQEVRDAFEIPDSVKTTSQLCQFLHQHFRLLFDSKATIRGMRLTVKRWLGTSALQKYFGWYLPKSWRGFFSQATVAGLGTAALVHFREKIMTAAFAAFTQSTQDLLDHLNIPVDEFQVALNMSANQSKFGSLMDTSQPEFQQLEAFRNDIQQRILTDADPFHDPRKTRAQYQDLMHAFVEQQFPDSTVDQQALTQFLVDRDKSAFLTQWTEYTAAYNDFKQDPSSDHRDQLAHSEKAFRAAAEVLKADGIAIDASKMDPSFVQPPDIDITNKDWKELVLWGSVGLAVLGAVMGVGGAMAQSRSMRSRFQKQDQLAKDAMDMNVPEYVEKREVQSARRRSHREANKRVAMVRDYRKPDVKLAAHQFWNTFSELGYDREKQSRVVRTLLAYIITEHLKVGGNRAHVILNAAHIVDDETYMDFLEAFADKHAGAYGIQPHVLEIIRHIVRLSYAIMFTVPEADMEQYTATTKFSASGKLTDDDKDGARAIKKALEGAVKIADQVKGKKV